MTFTTKRIVSRAAHDFCDIFWALPGRLKTARNATHFRNTLPLAERCECRQNDGACDEVTRGHDPIANQSEYTPCKPEVSVGWAMPTGLARRNACKGSKTFGGQSPPYVLAIVVLLATVGGARGAEPTEVVRLWPGDPPGAKREIGAEQDFTKDEDRLIAGKRIIKLGNVTTPELHVFLPPADQRNGTSVVICPGGGYHILAWDLEGTEVAEWLNSIGVAAMVLKYRVPRRADNPSEMAVQDAQRALSLVRSKTKDWGLAADRIGVLGFSAGGHAASLVCVNNVQRSYEPIDAVDEVPFRPDFGVSIYGAWMADDKTGELKPEFKPTKETPPMFFAHAADDGVKCESSVAMFLALKNLGIPSELHVYDAGGHGYGLRHDEKFPVTGWPKRCEEWIARQGWLKKGNC